MLSDEHYSVDGTLIEAWASHKSFQRIEECFGWGKVIGPLRKTTCAASRRWLRVHPDLRRVQPGQAAQAGRCRAMTQVPGSGLPKCPQDLLRGAKAAVEELFRR